MKVLFLDIDGVIVTSRSHDAYGKGKLMQNPDPVAMLLVDRICRETGAKIVLSSTWGPVYGAGPMQMWLQSHGIHPDHFYPKDEHFLTPRRHMSRRRGREIADWLEDAQERGETIEAHVALDDDGDFADDQPLIQTEFNDGLRFEEYERAIRLLNDITPKDKNAD